MVPPSADDFDPERFRATAEELAKFARAKPAKRQPQTRKGGRRFLYKVPWDWLCAAAKLAGRASVVGQGLWLLAGLERSHTVAWRPKIGAELGLTYHTFYRGLVALEAAGLVRVERHRGRSPVVTILDVRQTTKETHHANETKA